MLVVSVLAAGSPAAEPSPWLEIHSTHFTVITDAGDKKGREVALRFEQMRAVLGALLMKERLNDSLTLTRLTTRPRRCGRANRFPYQDFFCPAKTRISSC